MVICVEIDLCQRFDSVCVIIETTLIAVVYKMTKRHENCTRIKKCLIWKYQKKSLDTIMHRTLQLYSKIYITNFIYKIIIFIIFW